MNLIIDADRLPDGTQRTRSVEHDGCDQTGSSQISFTNFYIGTNFSRYGDDEDQVYCISTNGEEDPPGCTAWTLIPSIFFYLNHVESETTSTPGPCGGSWTTFDRAWDEWYSDDQNYGYAEIQYRTSTGREHSNEYTTAELTALVSSLVRERLPAAMDETSAYEGTPMAANDLASDESCASAIG
ncbi:hypothetical protein, partial [Limisphaera ngatamarikiensis]